MSDTRTPSLPARRNPGGRPVKLADPALRAKLIELLALGVPYKRACSALRLTFQCFQDFRKRHPEFEAEIDAAVGAAVERSLRRIVRAAESGDVASDRWLLERRWPEDWGRNRVELTGAGGAPLAGAIQIILPAKDALPAAVIADPLPKEITDDAE